MSFMIYEDSETILEKTNDCKKNPETYHMTKISKYKAYGFSVIVKSSHDETKNKQFFLIEDQTRLLNSGEL